MSTTLEYQRHHEMSRHTLEEQVHRLNWVHQIDLGQGVITPGRWQPHPLILKAFDLTTFEGKKVLDIGCWDGLWSFEAEKRGAREVFATDYITQRSYAEQPTFRLAHDALHSQVKYFPKTSVFNISSLGANDFDVALFCGVYYHLRCPLHALSAIRRVMREGGTLIVEGDVILDTDECYAQFHYRDWHLNDPSNWWIPTIPCLKQWIESSFFDIEHVFRFPRVLNAWQRAKNWTKRYLGRHAPNISRAVIVARAVRRKDSNYIFPDELLASFDDNEYAANRD